MIDCMQTKTYVYTSYTTYSYYQWYGTGRGIPNRFEMIIQWEWFKSVYRYGDKAGWVHSILSSLDSTSNVTLSNSLDFPFLVSVSLLMLSSSELATTLPALTSSSSSLRSPCWAYFWYTLEKLWMASSTTSCELIVSLKWLVFHLEPSSLPILAQIHVSTFLQVFYHDLPPSEQFNHGSNPNAFTTLAVRTFLLISSLSLTQEPFSFSVLQWITCSSPAYLHTTMRKISRPLKLLEFWSSVLIAILNQCTTCCGLFPVNLVILISVTELLVFVILEQGS